METGARLALAFPRVATFRDGSLAADARALLRELAFPDDLSGLAIESLGLEMLSRVTRLANDEPDRDRQCLDHRHWMARAAELVHDRFRERLTVSAIAAASRVHPAHLAATFRRVHRMSIASYVRRLRIDWAAHRLLDSRASISEIAADAGFADQAHMTRWFRRALGFTPHQYRQARRSSDRSEGSASSSRKADPSLRS